MEKDMAREKRAREAEDEDRAVAAHYAARFGKHAPPSTNRQTIDLSMAGRVSHGAPGVGQSPGVCRPPSVSMANGMQAGQHSGAVPPGSRGGASSLPQLQRTELEDTVRCCQCKQDLPRRSFSEVQLKKANTARCMQCLKKSLQASSQMLSQRFEKKFDNPGASKPDNYSDDFETDDW